MSAEPVTRKLVAVLHADVKDYSRLMAEDEDATVRTLSAYQEVMFALVGSHGGRVVDTAGDGFLIEFTSVVDAVTCAIRLQQEFWSRNTKLPVNRKMEFRIGINVGEVIQKGEKIFGDGVNIAARLEGLAEPGGICISGTAYDQVKEKLNLRYEDLGDQSLKNIPDRVRAYRIFIDSPLHAPEEHAKPDERSQPSSKMGEGPTIWNVPHQRNPNFTGRRELLEDIKEILTGQGTTARRVALYGLGGIGKTQIAVEYAYDRQEDYSLVWWVRAEEPATLAIDYGALAPKLGLSIEATSREAVPAVRDWLRRHEGWLLVFDNVEKPEDLKEYLSQENGSTIITSRNPNWRVLVKPEPMKVQELPREEAANFLLSRTGKEYRQEALFLAEQLGCLPLALEQAGAYIEATGSSYESYLEIFRKSHDELLKKNRPIDYPYTVATTWTISVDSLRKESPAAVDLMELCSFLAPESIPFDLFTEHPEHLPTSLKDTLKDSLKWNEVRAGLKRYSLAEVAQDYLSFHRLVQMVVRNGMGQAARKDEATVAVALLDEAYNFKHDNLDTWPRAAQLLPHGLAAAEHSHSEQLADKPTGHLLNEMGLHLRMLGQFLEAKASYERALKIAEKVYGPDHPEVATDLNNLGMALKDFGNLYGAKANLGRALRIDEKVYGPIHPAVARDLNNLGSVLRDLGDLERSKANHERALEIEEKVYGSDHPEVAKSLNNLGVVLKYLGDMGRAKASYDRALAILRAAWGKDHPKTKLVLENLKSLKKGK